MTTTTAPRIAVRPTAGRAGTLAREFDSRRNGLNGLRLLFAVLVIVSHSWPLSGSGEEPHLGHLSLGRFAVGGFFAISGFLVSGSRLHLAGPRYLRHRVLRIFPGYWCALILTAFVAAPVAWLHGHAAGEHLPLVSGAKYVVTNGLLYQHQAGVGQTLSQNPFPASWNGSLWTLVYEFLCYLLVAGLAAVGILRARSAVAVFALGVAVLVAGEAGVGTVEKLLAHTVIANVVSLGVYFAAGMVLRLAQDRVPVSWQLALVALAVAGAGLATKDPDAVLAAPLAYLCLYVAIRLPHSPSRDHDLSYGMYIYGFVVQQLLAVYDEQWHGVFPFVCMSVVLTAPLAALSWYLVERPALRLKDHQFKRSRPKVIQL